MPKIKVIYMKEVTEIMEWPDDEMDLFNYENLVANLDNHNSKISSEIELDSIRSVQVNGSEHCF